MTAVPARVVREALSELANDAVKAGELRLALTFDALRLRADDASLEKLARLIR